MRRFFKILKTRFTLSALVLRSARPKKNLVCLLFCLVISLLCSCQGTMEKFRRRLNAFRKSHPFGRPTQLGVTCVVETVGIEPATSCLQGRRSPRLSYAPGLIQDSGPED